MIKPKSRSLAVVLAFLFGPLGLFYVHAGWAVILAALALMTINTMVFPFLVWMCAIILAAPLADDRNKEMEEWLRHIRHS